MQALAVMLGAAAMRRRVQPCAQKGGEQVDCAIVAYPAFVATSAE